MIVYHATTEIVDHPLCHVGRNDVDFGKGFYVTNVLNQAQDWSITMSLRRGLLPVVNVYEFDRDAYMANGKTLVFSEYNEEWLKFVVECRRGGTKALAYDYIEGGVANDRVADTVKLYMNGLMDINTALGRLIYHKLNNQMCLKNQELVDRYLLFKKVL